MITEVVKIIKMLLNADGAKGQRVNVLIRFIWLHIRFVFQKEFIYNWVNNIRIYVTYRRRASTECYYYGLFDPEEMSIIRDSIKEGDVLVDVGANIGGYSLFAASYGAEVYAFEPAPSTFKLLERNVSINPKLAAKIHPVQKVVSDSKGEVDFLTDLDTVNRIVSEDDPQTRESAVMKVPSVTLDAFFNSINILKIDVEGFEKVVLGGAKTLLSKNDLKLIVLEDPDEDIVSFLSGYGFSQCRYDIEKRCVCFNEKEVEDIRPNGIFVRI